LVKRESNMKTISPRRALALGLGVVSLGMFGCGGSGGEPNPSPLVLTKTSTDNGDQQGGRVRVALANPLRVIVTRDGAPEAGVSVAWSADGGSVAPVTASTDSDGISTTDWTLGPVVGAQSAQAAVSGATGSPVTFTATATAGPPPPPPKDTEVTVGNVFFKSERNATTNPAVDTVAVNGTVTWVWTSTGTTSHSVESTDSPSFTSSAILTGNGQSYTVQFTQAGTYTYDCAVHKSSMTGRIVVR
jgi:plastocyanin